VNASPLIALGKIGEIALLESLCPTLVIPEGVAREIRQGTEDDPAASWLRGAGAAYVRALASSPSLVLSWDLGLGETEVISWAYLNSGFEAILDDRVARNCAASLGIPVRGTVGVVLLAKREGLLSEIKPLSNRLIESGFRIDPELLRKALELAEEE
jgi:predicted nucleic acid-binding protein